MMLAKLSTFHVLKTAKGATFGSGRNSVTVLNFSTGLEKSLTSFEVLKKYLIVYAPSKLAIHDKYQAITDHGETISRYKTRRRT